VSRRRRPKSGAPGSVPGSAAAPAAAGQQAARAQQRRWYKVDLHAHTPASADYEEPNITYLDWLRTAADKGLDIVAVTDHNTVAGIDAMRREVEWLTRLEKQNRLTDEERAMLNAWREVANRVLVIPGFEFTATFGFHIVGLFPPETPVRTLEHILLTLRVPPDRLELGSTETGASTDVITAYRTIREAGGLVIAAHANSTHGVAMRNFPFGGQTKIAYTQDPALDALEVTDLEQRGHSTARFFNGSKSEYPRRMHCIQGSDGHRLHTDPRNPKRLGLGDRTTDMLLDEASFEAIAAVLRSTAFDRTRPSRPKDKPFDPLNAARDEGDSIVQSFHENATQRGGSFNAILADVCAFANTAGGNVYIGASARKDGASAGIARPKQVEEQLLAAVEARITPPVEVRSEIFKSGAASLLRLHVAKGDDRPYCLDDNKFYVRNETDTDLAVRDEIVAMVLESAQGRTGGAAAGAAAGTAHGDGAGAPPAEREDNPFLDDSPPPGAPAGGSFDAAAAPAAADKAEDAFYLPQIGVEIVETEERHGNKVHTIRDLRNGNLIKNVNRRGARDLWMYALRKHEEGQVNPAKVQWQGNVGLVHVEKRAGKLRYDLALREGGKIRVFYGVTEDGMEGAWSVFVED
jgi:hypothetical protein